MPLGEGYNTKCANVTLSGLTLQCKTSLVIFAAIWLGFIKLIWLQFYAGHTSAYHRLEVIQLENCTRQRQTNDVLNLALGKYSRVRSFQLECPKNKQRRREKVYRPYRWILKLQME